MLSYKLCFFMYLYTQGQRRRLCTVVFSLLVHRLVWHLRRVYLAQPDGRWPPGRPRYLQVSSRRRSVLMSVSPQHMMKHWPRLFLVFFLDHDLKCSRNKGQPISFSKIFLFLILTILSILIHLLISVFIIPLIRFVITFLH